MHAQLAALSCICSHSFETPLNPTKWEIRFCIPSFIHHTCEVQVQQGVALAAQEGPPVAAGVGPGHLHEYVTAPQLLRQQRLTRHAGYHDAWASQKSGLSPMSSLEIRSTT